MENKKRIGIIILSVLLFMASLAATGFLLLGVLMSDGYAGMTPIPETEDVTLMADLDALMEEPVGTSMDAMYAVEKVFWIPEDKLAPMPDSACYGSTTDPSTLGWLIEEAADLLEGQELYFSTETKLIPGYKVTYYLDDTILVISWKENINYMAYTICEVKIAHPSQFRRHLAGGEYGSKVRKTTTELANTVNAVAASAGDFYAFRKIGITAYDGELTRFSRERLDTCFVDEDGNLVMVHGGELETEEEAAQFIEDNNISFGLTFGPILIENGQRCEPNYYLLGEIDDSYSRAGFGQKGELHYIMVTVNEEYFKEVPNLYQFATGVERFGCHSFYTLDGGHTATISVNGTTMNRPDWGYQRQVSDIIYFATALPNSSGETEEK